MDTILCAFCSSQYSPLSLLQHILNKYPVPPGWVVYEYVGDGTDYLAILDDRGAGHSLYHSACQVYESIVGHVEFYILVG